MKGCIVPLLISVAFAAPAAGAECAGAAFSTLQQMTGTWHVTKKGEPLGTLTVRNSAGGCAVIEEWQAVNGSRAAALHWAEKPADDLQTESSTAVLHQIYIDDTGWVMRADGRIDADTLIYEGEATLNGEDVILRATFHGLGSDTLVHAGDISKDNGASWQRMSTLHYRRTE